MRVEFLYCDSCPSHPQALRELRAAMSELGIDPEAVAVREVDSDDVAGAARFTGSPTIRAEGVDGQEPDDEPSGLSCRVYRLSDGRRSPIPDPEDLRDALRLALT